MDIQISQQGKWIELNVEGRLDTFNFEPISHKIATLLKVGKKFISINLDGVSFINIAAIRYFISVSKKLKNKNGHLALLFPSKHITAHLSQINTPKVLNIYESYKEVELAEKL